MTVTSENFANGLGQRGGRSPAQPIHYNYKQGAQIGQGLAGESRAGSVLDLDTPFKHPVADQIRDLPVAEQVKAVMADRCRFLGEFPSRRVMQDRSERIITAYSELRALGYQITDVTTFGLKHARALLESWRQRGLAQKTIYNRWSSLRGWAISLNKQGMLGSVEEFWPDFNRSEVSCSLTPAYTDEQLLARSDYLRQQSDKTAYFVDRLMREVGLVREAALEMELIAADVVVAGEDALRCGNGASVKIYRVESQHRALLQEAIDFMQSRQRSKLGWPGLSSYEAILKYRDRMKYVNRVLFGKGGELAGEKGGSQ